MAILEGVIDIVEAPMAAVIKVGITIVVIAADIAVAAHTTTTLMIIIIIIIIIIVVVVMVIKKLEKKLDTDIRSKGHAVQKRRRIYYIKSSTLFVQVQRKILARAMD